MNTNNQIDAAVKILQGSELTPYKIHKDTGLSQTIIGKWKSGESRPTRANALLLLQYFSKSDNPEPNTPINMKETETDSVTISREAWDVIRDQASAIRQMMEEQVQLREELAAAKADRMPAATSAVPASIRDSKNPPPLTKRKQIIANYLRFNQIITKKPT